MRQMKSRERSKSGFAFVKSIIALGLAAQMMLSSVLVSIDPVLEEETLETDTAAVELLDERSEFTQEEDGGGRTLIFV